MAEYEERPLTCNEFDIWILVLCSTSRHINEELQRSWSQQRGPHPHNPYSPPFNWIHTHFTTSHFSVGLVGQLENLNLPEREYKRKKGIPAHANPSCNAGVVSPLLKHWVSISFCYQSELRWFTQRPNPMLLPLATGHANPPPYNGADWAQYKSDIIPCTCVQYSYMKQAPSSGED